MSLSKIGFSCFRPLLRAHENYSRLNSFRNVFSNQRRSSENRNAMYYVVSIGVVAIGFTFAAIPAYRIFCEQTSFGGLTQVAKDFEKIAQMKKVEERLIRVQFNSDVPSSMQWEFKPQQHEMWVHPGETALAFYTARNPTDKPIIGISSYNLTPFQAAYYFNKIQCFCFEEQILNPGEQVDLPVFFYIDPDYANDPSLEYLDSILLSYTFFEAKSGLKLPSPFDPNNRPRMEVCPYGDKCYRKNPDHVKKFHSTKNRKRQLSEMGESSKEVKSIDPQTEENPPAKRPTTSNKNEYPTAVKEFWVRAQSVDTNGSVLGELRESLPFYATDLPEMSTFYHNENGHYALWRDEPRTDEFLIVHSTNVDHFPDIKLVGNRMEHFALHLLGGKSDVLKSLLTADCTMDDLNKEVKSVIAARKKKKFGNAPNGVGICVSVNNDIGYRPIAETAANIRKWITTVGTTENSSIKQKSMNHITEIFSYVQFANDECDFGMGLEFGHWLWLSNYKELTDLAEKVLSTAYRLLERDDYADVVAEASKNRKNLEG